MVAERERTGSPSGRRDGFSLIEVLVAQALLSVGLLSLAQLFGIGVVYDTRARMQSLAMALAQQKMESLAAQYTAGSELASGEETVHFYNLEDGRQMLASFQVIWTVQAAPRDVRALQVKLVPRDRSERPLTGVVWSRSLVFRADLAPFRR